MKTETEYIVYTISLGSKVMYVGCTKDYEKRKKEHLSLIGTKQSAIPSDIDPVLIKIDKYKVYKSSKAMLNAEDRLINKYNTIQDGWNKRRSGFVKKGREKEYQYEWYKTNRCGNREWLNHRKEMDKKYYQTHREEILIKKREYYLKKKIAN